MEVVLLTMVFFILLWVLPTALNRRAVIQVISIFRKKKAIGKDNAKTIDELGLRPPGFKKRLISLRDYKPRALEALIHAKIVQVTEEGRLYLSEEKLIKTS